jgi:hypothetical protein
MYNAVRLILQEAGYSVHGGGEQHFDPGCAADYQLIKVHPYRPQLAQAADYVFTSDRDDEGIRASWERFSGEILTDEKLQTWRGWLVDWNRHACFSMRFAQLSGLWRGFLIEDMCQSMGIPVDIGKEVEILKLMREIKPPTDKDYDPVTFLFRNHITTPA